MNKPYPSRGQRAAKHAQTGGLRGRVQPASKYRPPMKGGKNANC